MLDQQTVLALANTRTIDLTTIGRRSGRPVRIEIWWFHFEDRFIVTGTPGRRDWLANVLANPVVVVHARSGDHQGVARLVTDLAFRRRFFTDRAARWYSTQSQLNELVATAPMIEVELTGA